MAVRAPYLACSVGPGMLVAPPPAPPTPPQVWPVQWEGPAVTHRQALQLTPKASSSTSKKNDLTNSKVTLKNFF